MLAQRLGPIQFLRVLLGVASLSFVTVLGCSNPQDDFTSDRSDDPCNGNIPACDEVVGCILTDSSYLSGTFPGSGQFLVQTPGPATVEVDFFLLDPTAAGTSTTVTWYEAGCTSSFQNQVTGTVFVGQAENNQGEYSMSQALVSPGDHLVTFSSDSVTAYDVRVIVTPTTG